MQYTLEHGEICLGNDVIGLSKAVELLNGRWNTLDDIPKLGQRVEIAIVNHVGSQATQTVAYIAGVDWRDQVPASWKPTHWRASGPLPELAKED